jgi:excisionase family DNA binding protein
MEKQFLNTKEAAEFLGWSSSQIEKMTAPNVKVALKEKKPLPFYKIGRKLLFDKSELIEYVKGGKVVQMQLPKNEFELLKLPSLAA